MIVDLRRFVTAERVYWDELQPVIARLQSEPERRLPLTGVQRLHYLSERCSADLVRLDTFATEPGLAGPALRVNVRNASDGDRNFGVAANGRDGPKD